MNTYGSVGVEQAQFKQSYDGTAKQDAPPEGGLVRIANQISAVSERIDFISNRLSELGSAIHGPRPEPVSAGCASNGASVDSLSSRTNTLVNSLDRLQSAYESIVR